MKNTKLEICNKCWGTGHVHGGDENSTWSKSCEDCCGLGFVRVPKTNADRIRDMSDEELANFMAERNVNESTLHRLDKDHGLTAVQIEAIKHNVYCALLQWLKQPAEGDA